MAAALALGAFVPGWGGTLAFPAVALVLSIGVLEERDGEEVANLLRFALGLTAAYLATAVPLTLAALPPAAVDRFASEVLARWAVIGLALPGGATALAVRRGR